MPLLMPNLSLIALTGAPDFVVVHEAQDTQVMDESYVSWVTFMTMVCE